MEKVINGVKVNYILYGEGEYTLVLLHGWGQNIEMMKPIGDKLFKEYKILIIDLPGFGKSEEPKNEWMLDDYVSLLHNLLNELNIENIVLIGHSFGGKIALLYASKYNIKKLVLLASPFKKEIQKLSLKTKILKTAKKVPVLNKLEGFAKKKIGSTDYRNASDIMRKILVNHVNLDISEDVKKITCPTLIIWGSNDTTVPLERAYELEKLIKDSGVIVYENCTHYAYLERINQTIMVIRSFLGGE